MSRPYEGGDPVPEDKSVGDAPVAVPSLAIRREVELPALGDEGVKVKKQIKNRGIGTELPHPGSKDAP